MKLTMHLSEQLIEDTLESGFEYGISYWADIKSVNVGGNAPLGKLALMQCVEITLLDNETGKEVQINRQLVERGIYAMAMKYPQHFANILTENSDSETGDVLIQCAVFGDIIYG